MESFYRITGTVLRKLQRAKETEKTVVFEEKEMANESAPLFGPGRKVYISKKLAGDAHEIVVKVEFHERGEVR